MVATVEIIPLRVCRVCGLEAWTEKDLELFQKRKRDPYGRSTRCKKCFNAYRKSRYIRKPEPPYLRKCIECGLEAKTIEDLKLFTKGNKSRYKRKNHCLKCLNQKLIDKRKSALIYRVGRAVPIEIRRKLILRAKGKCESEAKTPCSGRLLVHHIDEDQSNNDLSNLLLLCNRHHVIEEHKLLEKSVLPMRGKNHWNWQENPTPNALYHRKWKAKRRAEAKILLWLDELEGCIQGNLDE